MKAPVRVPVRVPATPDSEATHHRGTWGLSSGTWALALAPEPEPELAPEPESEPTPEPGLVQEPAMVHQDSEVTRHQDTSEMIPGISVPAMGLRLVPV